MKLGHFYYITDQYYIDFPDKHLMKNKETISGQPHDRPCFYAFKDSSSGIYWMIPISSQTNKFKQLYQKKLARYKRCDTIVFGNLLGREKAFLIQNMCPITDEYINNMYIDNVSMLPVRIDGALEKELIKKAGRVLALQRKGINLIFPDVLKIEAQLLSKLKSNNNV